MSYNRNSLDQLIQVDPTTISNPISGEVIRGVYNGLHWTRDSAGTIIYGAPASGSANYIQDRIASAQTASIWVTGYIRSNLGVVLANNYWLLGRNVADNTALEIVRINSSNQIEIGVGGRATICSGSVTATDFNGITGINDTLTSTSTTLALTANKGKELQDNKVGNDTDIYTASAKVTKMITLSQSEYNAIGTKDANTMYIII